MVSKGRIFYLYALAFWGGLVTLGAELAASRLLAPFFGSSLPVWSSLIAIILLALAGGYALGGRLADRHPGMDALLHLCLAGSVLLALIPLAATPVCMLALKAMTGMRSGILLGSFLSAALLMGLPMVLLACITPFCVRLTTASVETSGRSAGRLFALSTLGSFLGSFLPALWLIPAFGTRNTYVAFGFSLAILVAGGYLIQKRWIPALAAALAAAGMLGAGRVYAYGPVKPGPGMLYETESAYHYIRVIEGRHGWRSLQLNEGVVSQSVYHPDLVFTFGEWDYHAVAPYFLPERVAIDEKIGSWAFIGLAGGTTPRLIRRLYGDGVKLTGVEIDSEIVETARAYFELDELAVETVVADGRSWLRTTTNRFDVISVDAYRQPYIPFELSTVEFFESLRERLVPPGVVALNAASPGNDTRLVESLATTMNRVFPSVFLIPLDASHGTTLIVGVTEPVTRGDFEARRSKAQGLILPLLGSASEKLRTTFGEGVVLTDDHAPVERLMDLMIWSYLADREAAP